MNVDAVVLHYGDVALTARCLISLNQQGLRNAIVIDNSAYEDGMGPCGGSVRKLPVDYRILVDTPARNLGFSAGINRAVGLLVRSNPPDALLIINNDCVLSATSLQKLANLLDSDPALGVVAPRVVASKMGKLQGPYRYHRLTGLTFRRLPIGFPFLSGCCLLARPNAALRDRLFDEAFFFYGEDVELAWRCRAMRVGTAIEEQAEVIHEGSVSSRRGSYFYEYNIVRGHMLLAEKLASGRLQHILFISARKLVLAIRAIIRSARGRCTIPWQAFLDAQR